jgi:hypothetical protein
MLQAAACSDAGANHRHVSHQHLNSESAKEVPTTTNQGQLTMPRNGADTMVGGDLPKETKYELGNDLTVDG